MTNARHYCNKKIWNSSILVYSEQRLYEWEKEVALGKYPLWEMINNVEKKLIENFENARNQGLQVHDNDLNIWALNEAVKYGHANFKVSNVYKLSNCI